jgi:hypothetical protein
MRDRWSGWLAGVALCTGFYCGALVAAVENTWEISWDGEAYGYLSHMDLREQSLLNPDNSIARLPEKSATVELRLNLRAQRDNLQLTMRPILLAQENRTDIDSWQQREGYLSQWQIRLQASESWSLSGGREILNWGPAQFASLASPFYFDNGRSDPLRELSGVDNAKLLWAPDREQSLSLAWITGSGHDREDVWRDTWLLKTEHRGDEWAGGLVVSQTPDLDPFFGLYGQLTVSDALLLYAEARSSTLANALSSPADAAQPFTIATPSLRRTDSLLGAAYAFESGQSINLEYLHYGHGYTADEEEAYFARAESSLLWAAQALSYAPALLGRDYLYLAWQSNPLESYGYWRLMATHSLTDHSRKLSAYIEYKLSDSVTALALGELADGHERQEFSDIHHSTLTLGLKAALP